MRNLRNVFVLGLLTLSVSGCSYFESSFRVDELNKAQAKGSPFTQQLTDEYRKRANESADKSNYEQAATVADRGLTTAEGTNVEPYELNDDWDLPQDRFDELVAARQRLTTALAAGRDKAPTEAAKAQAKFDCWVEDAAKTWEPDQFKACREDFLQAIETTESAVNQTPITTGTATQSGEVSAAANLDDARYYVFFDTRKADLTNEAKKSVATFAADIKARNPKFVNVYGYTDATGSKKSNQRMSEKRAAAVAETLIREGISAKMVKAQGKGATNPLVPNAKSEPSNRRVEIVLE